MKRKLLAITLSILTAISLLSFSSCAKETPYSLVSDATEKTNSLDSIDATMDMKLDMTMMGISMNIPMSFNIKGEAIHSEAPKIFADMKTEMAGISVSYQMYQENEYVYISMLGQNMKMKVEDAANDYDTLSTMNSMNETLPEDLFGEDVAIVENSDGTKTVSLSIPGDKFGEIYKDFVNEMNSSVADDGASVEDLVIENASVVVTVNKDGYVANNKLAFDMSFKMMVDALGDGNLTPFDISAKVTGDITYNNPGTPVTVTPMDGYADFPEVSADQLTDAAA